MIFTIKKPALKGGLFFKEMEESLMREGADTGAGIGCLATL